MHPMQTEIDTLLERIRDYRRHQGWSLNKLANAAGVPWSVLQGMDDPDWSPSLKTLRALLAVMKSGDGSGSSPRPRRPQPHPEGRAA